MSGSVARGESKKKSDVDILVDLDSDRNLFGRGGLQIDLQELLGCKVDVVTEGCLREKNRSKIKQQACMTIFRLIRTLFGRWL